MKYGAAELVDPKQYAVGKLKETFDHYPDLGPILPSMGYSAKQVADLEKTIKNTPCDLVLIATPIDINRLIKIKQPTVKIGYEMQEMAVRHLKTYYNFAKKQTGKQQKFQKNNSLRKRLFRKVAFFNLMIIIRDYLKNRN